MITIVKIPFYLCLIILVNGLPISSNNNKLSTNSTNKQNTLSNSSNGDFLTQGNDDFLTQLFSFLFGYNAMEGFDDGTNYGSSIPRNDYNYDNRGRQGEGYSNGQGNNGNYYNGYNPGSNSGPYSGNSGGFMTDQQWAQYIQLIQVLANEGGGGGGGDGFGDASQLINAAMGMMEGF